jgi:hypothetical protein
MGNQMERLKVWQAIDDELEHQRQKWGENKPQSLPGFFVVLQKELDEAVTAWVSNKWDRERDSPLAELVQVAAVAVAALEKYGTTGSAIATDDLREDAEQEEKIWPIDNEDGC